MKPALCLLLSLATLPLPAAQTLVLAETDPASPRHRRLPATAAAGEVLRVDLDRDGDPDLLETTWNGKTVRWLDENDDMTATDLRGDQVNDTLFVDMDGDGWFDGPSDITLKWGDNNGDGRPDFQVIAENPSAAQAAAFSGSSHYMIELDTDGDGVFSWMTWAKFKFDATRYTEGANWATDYHGNAMFLKEHMAPGGIRNPDFNWENPFAFYDTDGDGCSEMSIRLVDNRKFTKPDQSEEEFDGIVDEGFISFDLDNDTGRDNECDYDMTLRFGGGPGIDYRKDVIPAPALKAADWALPFFRFDNWRKLTAFHCVPRDQAVARLLGATWTGVHLTFDEDDDCHRWERTEIYYPGDAYTLKRWPESAREKLPRGIMGHNQADALGDRGEWDEDFSGGGKLYVTRWDGKLHLLGAESGAWLTDRQRQYWAAAHGNGKTSSKFPDKPEMVVLYRDTDKDGFFDEVVYDRDGDKTPELTVSFTELGIADQGTVLEPAKLGWKGLNTAFSDAANTAWTDALLLYRAAWRKGMTDESLDTLSHAASVGEKHNNAWWLKDELLLRTLAKCPDDTKRKQVLRLYFSGKFPELAALVGTLP
jgi:hypothetical protein